MLIKWRNEKELENNAFTAELFDGLLVFRCHKRNRLWECYASGADEAYSFFGFDEEFASEQEAKQAAEEWLSRKLAELNTLT